jgi:hypothetical protein
MSSSFILLTVQMKAMTLELAVNRKRIADIKGGRQIKAHKPV